MVADLSHGADVHDSDVIPVGLGLDGIDNVACTLDIDFQSPFRIHVCSRRYHPSDMQYVVSSGNALEYAVIVGQVAPDDIDSGLVLEVFQFLDIFLTGTCQQHYVESVPASEQLFESRTAHIAGGSGDKDSLFGHNLLIFLFLYP